MTSRSFSVASDGRLVERGGVADALRRHEERWSVTVDCLLVRYQPPYLRNTSRLGSPSIKGAAVSSLFRGGLVRLDIRHKLRSLKRALWWR